MVAAVAVSKRLAPSSSRVRGLRLPPFSLSNRPLDLPSPSVRRSTLSLSPVASVSVVVSRSLPNNPPSTATSASSPPASLRAHSPSPFSLSTSDEAGLACGAAVVLWWQGGAGAWRREPPQEEAAGLSRNRRCGGCGPVVGVARGGSEVDAVCVGLVRGLCAWSRARRGCCGWRCVRSFSGGAMRVCGFSPTLCARFRRVWARSRCLLHAVAASVRRGPFTRNKGPPGAPPVHLPLPRVPISPVRPLRAPALPRLQVYPCREHPWSPSPPPARSTPPAPPRS